MCHVSINMQFAGNVVKQNRKTGKPMVSDTWCVTHIDKHESLSKPLKYVIDIYFFCIF